MDDPVRPLDAPGEPDGSDTSGIGSEATAVGENVAAYAPPPREEVAPRFDLERDPFEPSAPTDPIALTAQDDAEAADMSLEDMVDELRTGEEPLDETGPADTEAAPEEAVPVEEEAPSDEGDESAEPVTWRHAVAAAPAITVPELVHRRLSTHLPFWIYGGAWAVFVGAFTYLMWPLSNRPFIDSPYYAYLVYGGAGMLTVGLVLALVVWTAARSGTSKAERVGLVRAICLRAVGWMAVGVILWWAGMYALDLHRLGVIG
jgi:hypothetical protein